MRRMMRLLSGLALMAVLVGLAFTTAAGASSEGSEEANGSTPSETFVSPPDGGYVQDWLETGALGEPIDESDEIYLEPLDYGFQPPGEECFFSGVCAPLINRDTANVQDEPHVYLILWGSNWNTTETGKKVKAALLKMFEGMSGSPWLELLSQYFDVNGGRMGSTIQVTSWVDTSVAAPTIPYNNGPEWQAEVDHAKEVNGWPLEWGDAQYFLMPAPGTAYTEDLRGKFCAYHHGFNFVPYAGDEPFKTMGCGGANYTDKTLEMASHEFSEEATNPGPTKWSGPNQFGNSEVADVCVGQLGTLPNGSKVTKLWSNHLAKCTDADPNPPLVYAHTGKPEAVTETSALVKGEVDPEGLPTTYWFEYGPTTAYGSKAPATGFSAGDGWKNVSVSQTLTGLTPETTYHWRLAAQNSTGTTYGLDSEFTPSAWTWQQPEVDEVDNRAVSCSGLAFCRAVGHNVSTGSSSSIWWGYDAIGWSNATVEDGVGGETPAGEGVSCPSISAEDWCMAVGHYEVGDLRPEAKIGTMWAKLKQTATPPFPTDFAEPRYGEFSSVDCSSETNCVAVGSYKAKQSSGTLLKPLVETWNGTSWQVQTLPSLSGASELNDVSCSSASLCTAVGSTKEGTATSALALRLNGGSWTRQTAKNPTGATSTVLEGVSCASGTSCFAVGKANDEAKEGTAQRWNGSEWTLIPPLGGPIYDVSCPSTSLCMAVGVNPGEDAQAEQWNGSSWVPRSPAAVESDKRRSILEGVSCTQVNQAFGCSSVGRVEREKENGQYWQPRSLQFRLPLIKPIVATGGVTGLGTLEPTVHATIDPEGVPTTYRFYYGTTNNTLIPETAISVGSGTSPVEVSQQLPELKAGTTYTYSVLADNGESFIRSEKRTFTTPATTVLCKTAESPCLESNRYAAGTALEANLKSGTKSLIDNPFAPIECTSGNLTGATTDIGGFAKPVNLQISGGSFSCSNSWTLKVEATPWNGYLTRTEGTTDGVLNLSNLKLTASRFGIKCEYTGEAPFDYEGGTEPELTVSQASLARTGGSGVCGSSGSWSATFALTAPNPVTLGEPMPLGSTVICKTSEEPCAEANRYGSGTPLGTALKAETKSTFTNPIAKAECSSSSLAGQLTGAGGSGQAVPVEISAASFSGCANNVTMTAEGLPWTGTIARDDGRGNGTLYISNAKFKWFRYGITCVYADSVTAQIKANSEIMVNAPMKKASGSSVCGSDGSVATTWSGSYAFNVPSPLFITWP